MHDLNIHFTPAQCPAQSPLRQPAPLSLAKCAQSPAPVRCRCAGADQAPHTPTDDFSPSKVVRKSRMEPAVNTFRLFGKSCIMGDGKKGATGQGPRHPISGLRGASSISSSSRSSRAATGHLSGSPTNQQLSESLLYHQLLFSFLGHVRKQQSELDTAL